VDPLAPAKRWLDRPRREPWATGQGSVKPAWGRQTRGLGGWVDEMAELVREAGPHVSTEKSTGHL